jgi:uncharacterized membrane protein
MGFNRWHVVMILLSIIFIGASVYLPMSVYDALPDRYPTHFNLTGEPDSWSNKNISSVLAGPAIVAATNLMMLLIAWWISIVEDPRCIINGPKEKIKNMPLERAEEIRKVTLFHLLLIMLLVSMMVLVISIESVIVAMGKQPTLSQAILIITGVLLGDTFYMTWKLLRLVYGKGR